MIPFAAAGATTGIAAGTVLAKVLEGLRGRIQGSSASNLGAATAPGNIRGRAYVGEDIGREDCIPNILRCTTSIWSGMVLTCMSLETLVSQGVTVRDMLDVVRTHSNEDFMDVNQLIDGDLSFEALTPEEQNQIDDDVYKAKGKAAGDSLKPTVGDVGSIKGMDGELLPVGRQITVNLTSPESSQPVPVKININITPMPLSRASMLDLLTHGSSLSFRQRWMQFTTGERAFWADLIFNADRTKDVINALKNDKTGGYQKFLSSVNKKSGWQIFDWLFTNRKKSNNVATNTIICSEDSVREAKARTGIDLERDRDAERFMQDAQCLALFIVDPSFQKVRMRIAGLSTEGHYNYSDFAAPKKSEQLDFVSIMKVLNAGQPPRF